MEERIVSIIKVIRESFGGSVGIYTQGNCYQFFEILKTIFSEAVAYESGGHVYTKIDGQFYDIRGKLKKDLHLILVEDSRIESLTKNKWTDERVLACSKEWREQLKINNYEVHRSNSR
jgi:hypothetical protein